MVEDDLPIGPDVVDEAGIVSGADCPLDEITSRSYPGQCRNTVTRAGK
jgi:hypothetical protein